VLCEKRFPNRIYANAYLQRINIHILQQLRIPITAYVEHDVFPIAGLELIDDVKIKKCLRDKSSY